MRGGRFKVASGKTRTALCVLRGRTKVRVDMSSFKTALADMLIPSGSGGPMRIALKCSSTTKCRSKLKGTFKTSIKHGTGHVTKTIVRVGKARCRLAGGSKRGGLRDKLSFCRKEL